MKLSRDRCKKTECITTPYSNDIQSIKHGYLVSSYSTDVPTTNAKPLTPSLEGGGWSKIEVKDGLVKLGRDRCRMIEYIIIPYSNDSVNVKYGCVVSSSTDVPTKNAKSLTPLLEF